MSVQARTFSGGDGGMMGIKNTVDITAMQNYKFTSNSFGFSRTLGKYSIISEYERGIIDIHANSFLLGYNNERIKYENGDFKNTHAVSKSIYQVSRSYFISEKYQTMVEENNASLNTGFGLVIPNILGSSGSSFGFDIGVEFDAEISLPDISDGCEEICTE